MCHNVRVKNILRKFHSGRAILSLMVFICSFLACAALKIAAPVILPFTIALLLTFAVYPLVKIMDKLKIPRLLSILLVIFMIIAFIYGLIMILYTSGKMIASYYPKYESRFTEIYVWAANLFGLSYDEDLSFFENLWAQLGIRTFVRNFTFTFSNFFIQFLKNAFLMVIFLGFLLVEAGPIKKKIEVIFGSRSGRINQMGRDLVDQISRYLTAKFLISLANGVIFAFGFWLIGLEFAFVWGVIQFIMNFIPALGSIVAGFTISIFALIQFWPDPVPVVLVVILILAVNVILGNILDPKIIGEHVGISPLMVLLSLLIWGWVWGFAGMVLAVPMTVIIKIVCENIPIMEPVSIIIGSRKSVNAKKTGQEKTET